jgi:enoyl-CoA hydratase/carnithine racemase
LPASHAKETDDMNTDHMNYVGYTVLDITQSDAVTTVSMNHPPLNLLDAVLMPEVKRFVREVASDTSTKVIVFESAVPDFFIGHGDAGFTSDPEGMAALTAQDTGFEGLTAYQHLGASIRALPQVTIAKLRGYLRGGGMELAMATDLSYAADGQTWMGQIEARMGTMPGGGGTQLLARAVGRSRALEVVLTGDLYDARTAERYGWITRAVAADELDSHVNDIAHRIGARRASQISAMKAAINPITNGDGLGEEMKAEVAALFTVFPPPDSVQAAMSQALKDGLQTPEHAREEEAFLDRYLGATER